MSIKSLINGLKTQLSDYSGLSYASDSGHVVQDPYELVKKNSFPFFNIEPIGETIDKVDSVSFREMERTTYTIIIQLATRSLKKNVAILGDNNITGILDFIDDVWEAIKSDRTIGGVVNGITPGTSIGIDIIELDDGERSFTAVAEMTIEFYTDAVV